jgi:hypothetical protein
VLINEVSTTEEKAQARGISGPALWTTLAVYSILLLVLGYYHEMWRDEVRAFSVAINAGSWGQLLTDLRAEGHPILWYVVLRVGYGLTHSHLVLPAAGIIVAIGTAYVILRYAPFPVWLRVLALFGAFLGYELSVVSRNYGIGVLFMLLACIAYSSRREKPWLLALMIALTANTSVHAAMASLVLIAFWLTDLFDSETRPAILSHDGIASAVFALIGVALALATARPTPDMAWAFSSSKLDIGAVLRSVLIDPGKGLIGYRGASIAAAAELPWRLVHIDAMVAARIIVNACLAWLAWNLRGSWRGLVALLITIIGFEIFFRNVYTAGLRHEGIVLFLIFSICWMAVVRSKNSTTIARRIALGLLPLFVVQSAALPVMAVRYIRYQESNSEEYGKFIRGNPAYRNAILIGEPDFMMESMPYYVPNRIYMPRQGEFHYRVYFDNGARRTGVLSLDRLVAISDSIACANQVPVLLAIGYPEFDNVPQGSTHPLKKGTLFRWDSASWESLHLRQPDGRHPVGTFPYATTDEIYRIYQVSCGKAKASD